MSFMLVKTCEKTWVKEGVHVCVCCQGFNLQSESPHCIFSPFSSVKNPRNWVLEEEKKRWWGFSVTTYRYGRDSFPTSLRVYPVVSQSCCCHLYWMKAYLSLVGLFSVLLQDHVCLKFILCLKNRLKKINPCLSWCSHLFNHCFVALTVSVITVWHF